MSFKFNIHKPIYVQLADEIKQRIALGIYRVNDKLPSVREFAEEFSVNPNTMQKALTELENEGYIYTERTTGKFVSSKEGLSKELKMEMAKEVLNEYMNQMLKLGFAPKEAQEFMKTYGRE